MKRRQFLTSSATAAVATGLWSTAAKAQDAVKLVYPYGLAVDPQGVPHVADRKLPGVVKLVEGKAQLVIRGSRKFKQPLNAVWSVAFDKQGKLLVGDSATREVYRIVEGKPQPLTGGRVLVPMALAVTSKGDVLVADLQLQRIWRVPAAGGKPEEFARAVARGLFVDPQDRVWAVVHQKDQLVRFSADGKQRDVIVSGRPFGFPHNVVVDGKGTAYVSDGYGKAVWKVAGDGKPAKWAEGGPLRNPIGLALHKDTVLVADSRAKMVFSIDAAGKVSPLIS